jgi:putative PEP-CTERM system TPR-repeat lipoprotein
LGQGEKSREYLEAILGRNGKHLAAQMLLANTLMESNELGRAVPVIESLLRANPNDAQALYMMGTVHLMRRQHAQASDFLERAAKAAPTGPALRELSFSQFGLGQDKSALTNLEKAYAQNPKDYVAGIELAIFHARTGNAAKALKIAQALVALDPSNLAMVNFLGNIKGRLGDRKGLRETYESALAKDPKFRPVVINMAWLDIEEGRLDAARIRLKAYLKDQPKDPDILFQLGIVERTARKPAEAIALWTEADRIQQKDPRPGLSLVDVHLSEQQTDKALAAAKGLLANYADDPQVQLALARAYMASGDASLARKALTDASSKAGTDSQALMNVARMQLQLNNPDGAAHAATKALQANPNDPLALAMTVEVAGRRGNPAEVDKAMAQLQAKHPNHPVTLVTAGHIAFSRGQMPKATASYKSAFDREPSTSLALTLAQAYAVNKENDKAVAVLEAWSKKQPGDLLAQRALADMQLFTGKGAAARQSYEALSKAAPADPGIQAGYAKALLRLGDPAAVGVAEKAFKLAPTNPALMDIYGLALTQHGNLEAGLRILRDARVREPGNAGIRLHLAMALAKSGKKAEAKEELQAALNASPPIGPGPEVDRLKAELGL